MKMNFLSVTAATAATTGRPDAMMSGRPDVRTTRCLDIWTPGRVDLQTFGCLDVRTSRRLDARTYLFQFAVSWPFSQVANWLNCHLEVWSFSRTATQPFGS